MSEEFKTLSSRPVVYEIKFDSERQRAHLFATDENGETYEVGAMQTAPGQRVQVCADPKGSAKLVFDIISHALKNQQKVH